MLFGMANLTWNIKEILPWTFFVREIDASIPIPVMGETELWKDNDIWDDNQTWKE